MTAGRRWRCASGTHPPRRSDALDDATFQSAAREIVTIVRAVHGGGWALDNDDARMARRRAAAALLQVMHGASGQARMNAGECVACCTGHWVPLERGSCGA